MNTRVLGLYVAIFGTLGVLFGLVGFLSVQWAEGVYIASAQGDAVETLGPLFAGFVTFQNSILLQFLGPVLTMIFGFIFGSREFSTRSGSLTGGVGGVIGYVALIVPSLLIVILAPSRSQVYPVGSILTVLVGTVLISGIAGAVGGYVGVKMS